MGVKESLAQIGPDRMGTVEFALTEMAHRGGESERDDWIAAVDSGLYKYTTLATVLRKESGVSSVTGRNVADWAKARRGEA